MQLGDDDKVLAFRVAATRFADIRRAIAEELYATMGVKGGRWLMERYYASVTAQS
jgi:hypothetical protein